MSLSTRIAEAQRRGGSPSTAPAKNGTDGGTPPSGKHAQSEPGQSGTGNHSGRSSGHGGPSGHGRGHPGNRRKVRVKDPFAEIKRVVHARLVGSLGLIFVKRLKDIGALQLQAWITVVGGPALLLISLALESGQWTALVNADASGWGALAFNTIMSSLVAHTGWYYLVGRYPVTSLSPLTLLSPIFGVFFGVTLLHDELTPKTLLGSAVTLLGVLIVLMREKHIASTAT